MIAIGARASKSVMFRAVARATPRARALARGCASVQKAGAEAKCLGGRRGLREMQRAEAEGRSDGFAMVSLSD